MGKGRSREGDRVAAEKGAPERKRASYFFFTFLILHCFHNRLG